MTLAQDGTRTYFDTDLGVLNAESSIKKPAVPCLTAGTTGIKVSLIRLEINR